MGFSTLNNKAPKRLRGASERMLFLSSDLLGVRAHHFLLPSHFFLKCIFLTVTVGMRDVCGCGHDIAHVWGEIRMCGSRYVC